MDYALDHDDGVRVDQSLEALAKLKPYFEKPDGEPYPEDEATKRRKAIRDIRELDIQVAKFKVGDIEVTTLYDGHWDKPHDPGFIRNASVAETGFNDSLEWAQIGFSLVGNDTRTLNGKIDKIFN